MATKNTLGEWRRLYGVKQQALAREAGIHPKHLSRIENGGEPSLTNAIELCAALSRLTKAKRESAAAPREDRMLKVLQARHIPDALARQIIRALSPLEIRLEHVFYPGDSDGSTSWAALSSAQDDLHEAIEQQSRAAR